MIYNVVKVLLDERTNLTTVKNVILDKNRNKYKRHGRKGGTSATDAPPMTTNFYQDFV